MSEYISEVRKAIRANHGCDSVHLDGLPMTEMVHGKAAWEGTVEIMFLRYHAKADIAYAWGQKNGDTWEISVVLKVPPVMSPQSAVRAVIAATSKREQSG